MADAHMQMQLAYIEQSKELIRLKEINADLLEACEAWVAKHEQIIQAIDKGEISPIDAMIGLSLIRIGTENAIAKSEASR